MLRANNLPPPDVAIPPPEEFLILANSLPPPDVAVTLCFLYNDAYNYINQKLDTYLITMQT